MSGGPGEGASGRSGARTGRVAVVGVGSWGRNIARCFAELGALAAVVDTDPTAAAEAMRLTGAAARPLGDVLADPLIPGLAIATRAETHFQLAEAALAAGKHVFVEKPMVLNEGDANRLILLGQQASRIVMVGHLLRHHPAFRGMLELVRSGELGQLRHIQSDRLGFGTIRTEEDVLWSVAPHDVSMALALAGAEPERVTAQGSCFVTPGIADVATLQMRFAAGVGADVRVSWISTRKRQRIAAICDLGTIVFEDSEAEWSRKLSVHRHWIERTNGAVTPRRGDERFVEVPFAEPLKEECEHFLGCLSRGERPLTDGEEGRSVLRVLERARQAIKLGGGSAS